MTSDEKMMARALRLARFGGRAVAPNPMVGAVIVKNGKVIGEGYHEYFGGPHAEVNAIASVKRKADLEGATMYVTLEPCVKWGKTPPCLSFVEAMGVSRVVCGSADPLQTMFEIRNSKLETNANVLNSNFKITFLSGSVARECRGLNKFFFKWVEQRRPFVTVKIAVSADGFVAREDGSPVKLTTAPEDREVHRLRAQHQAIMVGVNTVLSDDPQLNVRHAKGPDPLRVVLDSRLRLPRTAKVMRDSNVLIAVSGAIEILHDAQDESRLQNFRANVWSSPTKTKISLKKLLRHLAKQGISSVLAEPGPTLYRSLKKQGLIDELIVYRSKIKLGSGIKMDF